MPTPQTKQHAVILYLYNLLSIIMFHFITIFIIICQRQ